ncbi:hypothetical protein D8M21_09970 [Kocuria sp. HSID16901]|nr:hypothetical protein D8M21_09970 [Kocuria sp. HSID16901]
MIGQEEVKEVIRLGVRRDQVGDVVRLTKVEHLEGSGPRPCGDVASILDQEVTVLGAGDEDRDLALKDLILAIENLVLRGGRDDLTGHLIAAAQNGAELDSLRQKKPPRCLGRSNSSMIPADRPSGSI